MKSYFKQIRLPNQTNERVQQSVRDSVALSEAGKKRLFEKMKEHAIDQIKMQCGEK
jgi:hypothetical protein